jgi:hypothetical protein
MQILPKTFEYPFPLAIPTHWLSTSNQIWNDALRMLEWRQYWLRLRKCIESEPLEDWGEWLILPIAIECVKPSTQADWGLCCAIGRDQRIDKTKSWDKGNIEFRYCRNIVPAHWLEEPPINGFSDISLKKPFTAKRGYNVNGMPTGLVQDLLKTLAESWKMYQKGKRGKPKYRGRKNPVQSLSYDGFRHFCKLREDGTVKLLGMPAVCVHGIKNHLIPLIEKTAAYLKENPIEKVLKKSEESNLNTAADFYAVPGAYALVQRSGKTYLQISGQFYISTTLATAAPIEIKTGIEHLWESNRTTVNHCDNSGQEKKLIALQRQLSKAKFGSNNWQAIKNKISKVQEKIKKRTKRYQQYHAQLLANHRLITVLPYVPEISPAPVPRPNKDGRYLPNGATAIAEQNQKRSKAATAQFLRLTKDKCLETKAEFVDKRKGDKLDLESQEIDRQASPQADVKQPKSLEHGQSQTRAERSRGERQQGRKAKADSQISQNAVLSKSRGGRNRKRERAIG